ncbi:ras-related protein rab-4a [Anaeramoeba ignava]|uniref:Ras-related protein rab-4a n=1 Tax=Anaeramoeba ignava TaxID=1746090 RepID=A0A9Q0R6V2_ANAIG|nr:ras-related protein rab-4a [Anaeramoeba ignava]
MATYNYIFKYIIIGAMGTGKSSLLHRFTEGKFIPECPHTIGVEFSSRIVEIMKDHIKIQVWDTAGQERFRAVTKSYFRGALGVLLVFDTSRRNTFVHLNTWLSDVNKCTSPDAVIVMIGNKTDIQERQVSFEEAKNYADEHGLTYLETSAKTGENVETAFLQTARIIYEKIKDGKLDLHLATKKSNTSENPQIIIDSPFENNPKKKSKGCC